MTMHDLHKLASEYRTRLQFCYEFNRPYSTLSDRIRRGEVALHLIDGKVQVNVAEALRACEPKRIIRSSLSADLFA